MDRPVIVTGAAGFAGSHLVEHLAEILPAEQALEGWHRPAGRLPDLTCRRPIRWRGVDLLDASAVDAAISSIRPSRIYHCAGSPHVASSWSDTLVPLESNVLSTHFLLSAMERHCRDARAFVPSSALVYHPQGAPISEDAPLAPRTPYGISKLAQELTATRAEVDRGLLACVARPFNHIGPRQDASFVVSGFARQIAEAETGRRPAVIHVGNLDARRDLCDVRDTVRAYRLIADFGAPSRTYNVCSGQAHRVGDLLDRLLGLARVRVDVRVDPARLRPSDIPLLVGDPSRIASELGWRVEIPIDETLGHVLGYWRARLQADNLHT